MITPGDSVFVILNGEIMQTLPTISGKTNDALTSASLQSLLHPGETYSSCTILITNIRAPEKAAQRISPGLLRKPHKTGVEH